MFWHKASSPDWAKATAGPGRGEGGHIPSKRGLLMGLQMRVILKCTASNSGVIPERFLERQQRILAGLQVDLVGVSTNDGA